WSYLQEVIVLDGQFLCATLIVHDDAAAIDGLNDVILDRCRLDSAVDGDAVAGEAEDPIFQHLAFIKLVVIQARGQDNSAAAGVRFYRADIVSTDARAADADDDARTLGKYFVAAHVHSESRHDESQRDDSTLRAIPDEIFRQPGFQH